MVLFAILAFVLAYLLGNVNGAIVISRLIAHEDVRSKGSGNAGLTNFCRSYGVKYAPLVILTDVVKMVLAVVIACLFLGWSVEAKVWGGLFCVLGHMFPLFAGFKGGKGVATLVGCMFAFSTGGILLALATFLVIVATTHYVSVGSMVGGLLLPFYSALCGDGEWQLMLFMACVSLLLFYTAPTLGVYCTAQRTKHTSLDVVNRPPRNRV